MPTVRILPELERKVLFVRRSEVAVHQVNPNACEDLHDVPGLFGEGSRYLMRSDRIFARPSRPLCDALRCAGDRNIIYQA